MLSQPSVAHEGGMSTYDKAKGEPRVRLDDMPRQVAAVVALAGDALIAFYFLTESVLAACEDETHDVVVVSGEFRELAGAKRQSRVFGCWLKVNRQLIEQRENRRLLLFRLVRLVWWS